MHFGRQLQQVIDAGAVALAPARYTPKWIDWHPPLVPEGSLLIFTAADAPYFRKYAAAFLSSLVRQHPGANVHFHLFDPDQECLDTVARWKTNLPSVRIGYSWERLPEIALGAPKPSQAKQSWRSLYICCARFLAAQQVQRQSNASMLMMDIDVIFADRLDCVIGGAHYCLLPRLAQKNWCKRTLGGVVFAAATPEGSAFLDHACIHIRKFLNLGLYWFAFDQYALYLALMHMKRREGLAHFRALTPEHVSFDLSAKAPILYPKGKSKEGQVFKSLLSGAMLVEQSWSAEDFESHLVEG